MASESTGGFIGDLLEAFTPPAAGGCCGGPAPTASDDAVSVAVSCCGGTAEAGQAAQTGCCGRAPATPVAATAGDAPGGCCG
ncbi:hypothetical protein [Streptosporangium sp. LJ11]|uniref:hypothetical protein n=1 Tax=Streptosporangium sp. LJ11 TaxID=3436927 RepID=UPI003F78D8CF